VDCDDVLVPTSIYHTKRYKVTVASNCVAAEVHERNDIAIETTFLKGDGVTVYKRETTMILEINCVDAYVGRYWPYDESSCHDSVTTRMSSCSSMMLRHSAVVLLLSVYALTQPIDTSL